MNVLVRAILPLLLLSLLASCSVYDSIVHPRRLPTPKMSSQAKAKFKASEKARHKGMVLKSDEPVTNATDPNAPAGSEVKKDNKLTYSELSAGTKAEYDKEGLLKGKPNLKRRQYHRYDTRPLKPNDVNRENRRLRKHSKGKDSPTPPDSKTRADQPVEDAPAPTEKPIKAPKDKAKKAPVPKPDPTLEQPGN